MNYKGYDVYSTGPWGQGPTFPQALKILEGFDLASMGHNSADYIHTVSQALNLAFADRERYVGDPDFVDVPLDEMLSEKYIAKRRGLIDSDLAWPGTPPAGDPRHGKATLDGAPQSPHDAMASAAVAGDTAGGTSYFAVIDRDGNIFSCTPSEGTKNGGPIIPGTGLAFSLRGTQSKLTEGHPAAVAGGKRPRLTPAPALVVRDGEPVMALGAHGGDHIPQGTLQLLLNVLEFGRDSQEAVEEPRFYSYNFPGSGWASPVQPRNAAPGRPNLRRCRRAATAERPHHRAVSRVVGGFGSLLRHHPQPGDRRAYREAPTPAARRTPSGISVAEYRQWRWASL